MNRRVKVSVYDDVDERGDKFGEPKEERWLIGSRAERLLAMLDDFETGAVTSEEWLRKQTAFDEQITLANVRIEELARAEAANNRGVDRLERWHNDAERHIKLLERIADKALALALRGGGEDE
jgi:hypothetical protein